MKINYLEVSFDAQQSSFTYRGGGGGGVGGEIGKDFLAQKINEVNLSKREETVKKENSPMLLGGSSYREKNTTCNKFSPFVKNLMKSSRKSQLNIIKSGQIK